MSFRVTFKYVNHTPVSVLMSSQEEVDAALARVRESKSGVESFDTPSGGVVVNCKEIQDIIVAELSDSGEKTSEQTIKGEPIVSHEEEFGPKEPEVLPPDDELGHLPVGFSSFREKIVNSLMRQDSWMTKIVEKSKKREELLQKAASKLDDDNENLEKVLKDEFGSK